MPVVTGIAAFQKKTKNQLQATQNRLVRFVLDLPYRAQVGPAQYKEVGWLPVDLRVQQIKATTVYRIFNGLSPSYMHENLIRSNSIHTHKTRASELSYFLPTVCTYGACSFFFTGEYDSKCC